MNCVKNVQYIFHRVTSLVLVPMSMKGRSEMDHCLAVGNTSKREPCASFSGCFFLHTHIPDYIFNDNATDSQENGCYCKKTWCLVFTVGNIAYTLHMFYIIGMLLYSIHLFNYRFEVCLFRKRNVHMKISRNSFVMYWAIRLQCSCAKRNNENWSCLISLQCNFSLSRQL